MNALPYRRFRSGFFALSCVATLLTGCPGADRASRDCQGLVFGHPRGADWIDYEVGDRLVFSGPNSTATYETVAVEDLRNQDALSLAGGDSKGSCTN